MAKETKKILICDVCSKKLEYPDLPQFGGHPANGWFEVNLKNETSGVVRIGAKHPKTNWDVCSIECLRNIKQ